jgi:hypothetical protein
MQPEPGDSFDFRKGQGCVLLIACGALAREIVWLIEANRWRHLDVACLPAKWHNTPDRIPGGVREKIREARGRYEKIFVLYGDCGTGGMLDRVLEQEGVERIGGPHCYSFFSGNEAFAARMDDEIAAFYLTDYLVRHFDTLIWQGLGLDRHPELRDDYFGNYEKIVYLAQMPTPELEALARAAAERLGLAYEFRATRFGDLEVFLHEDARSPMVDNEHFGG